MLTYAKPQRPAGKTRRQNLSVRIAGATRGRKNVSAESVKREWGFRQCACGLFAEGHPARREGELDVSIHVRAKIFAAHHHVRAAVRFARDDANFGYGRL